MVEGLPLCKIEYLENIRRVMIKIRVLVVCITMLTLLFGCGKNNLTTIKVSPTASDKVQVESGKEVSLSTAQAYIQELNKTGNLPKGGITVELAGGVYPITETVVFSSEDGGKEGSPVIYKAKEGETPIFSGGKVITGWEDQGNNVWKVTLPEVAEGKLYFRQLFSNDKRLTRARTPNEGWYSIEGYYSDYDTFPTWGLGLAQEIKPNDPKLMCGARFDLSKLPLGEPDMKQAEIQILSSWSQAWTTIQSVNEKNGDVLFNTPLDWPTGIFDRPNSYRYENVRSALDQSGEWYVNATTGEVLIQVEDGEDPNDWEVIVPTLEMLVKVDGKKEKPVENLTFEGIHFKYAKVKMGVYENTVHEHRLTQDVDELLWDWPADIQRIYPDWPDADEFMPGYVDLQGAVYAGGAFEVSNAKDITIKNSKFSHLGAHGIFVRLRAFNTEISNSEFVNLGGGGIYQGYITDEYLMHGLDKEDVPSHSLIKNNLIHQGTEFHVGAVGIFLSQTHDNQIINNEIKEMGYSGISMGWTWGFQPNLVYNNLIARNHIHHVVDDMADGGPIYTLGTLLGCVIEENYLHNTKRSERAVGAHIKGLYFDQGSQGVIVRRNVLHDIEDNYISYHKDTPLTSFVFEDNYLADSVLTHDGDYKYYEYHEPGFDVTYASPGDVNFPQKLVDEIVAKAGIQK